jgi:hypothetical protein
MDTSQRFGALLGTSMRKWTEVLSPVLFLMERQAELLPIIRMHKLRGLEVIMADKKLADLVVPSLSKEGALESHIEQVTKLDADRIYDTVFDAAMVFGHAVLDDALDQALEIASVVRPAYFEDQIAQRTVSIQMVKETGQADLVRNQVEKWLVAKRRDSVPAKVDALFAVTKPQGNPSREIEDFEFNMGTLKQLDDLRHSLAHGPKLRRVTYEDLNYLRKCTMLITVLLSALGLKTEPEMVIRHLSG